MIVLASLPSDADAQIDWAAIERGLTIVEPARLRGSARTGVSAFADSSWSLKPLDGTSKYINWVPKIERATRIPPHFVGAAKRVIYLTLNFEVPADRAVGARYAWRAGGSICTLHVGLRRFLDWLGELGHERICEVTSEDLDNYANHVRQQYNGAHADSLRNAVTDLWRFSGWLPDEDRLVEPSWITAPNRSLRPRRGENLKAVIPAGTLSGLVWWASRVVENGNDIVEAVNEYHRMRSLALSRKGTRDGLAHARSVLESLPVLPGKIRGTGTDVAGTYLAGRHGGAHPSDFGTVLHRLGSSAPSVDAGLRQPIGSVVLGRLEGTPWLGPEETIDWRDLTRLQHVLTGACVVLLAGTSMLRGKELVSLQRGAIREIPFADRPSQFRIDGNKFKGVRSDGQMSLEGEPRTWATASSGAQAVRLLERLADAQIDAVDRNSVFNSVPHLGPPRPITVAIATEYIERLQEFANDRVRALDLPESLLIPTDPNGLVTIDRFRRTLTWSIARGPRGRQAARLQLGHEDSLTTARYGASGRSGADARISPEYGRAMAETLNRQYEEIFVQGGGVSGAGAGRLAAAAAKHGMEPIEPALLSRGDLNQIRKDPERQIFESDRALVVCVFDPDTALCLQGENTDEPSIADCNIACPNRAQTDATAERAATHVLALRAKAELAPIPVAALLRRKADWHEVEVNRHMATRVFPAGEHEEERND